MEKQLLHRLQSLYENADFGIGSINIDDGNLLYANKTLARHFGFDDETEFAESLYFKEALEKNGLLQALLDNPDAEQDGKVQRRDGTSISIRVKGRLSDNSNELDFTLFDISKHKNMEMSLRESEERFRSLNESSSQGILVHRSFQPLYANKALADMFGYESPDEILSLDSTSRLWIPEENLRIRTYHEARLKGDPAPVDYEMEGLRKNGSVIIVNNRSFKINWSDGPAICTTLFDVTDRTKAEIALHKSEQRFRDFADSASDWYWEMGPDLRFTYFSNRIDQAIGSSHQYLIGKTREELGAGDAEDQRWVHHLETLKAHKPFRNFEYGLKREDGTTASVRISGIPKYDADGHFLGYRGTGADISREKKERYERRRLSYALEQSPATVIFTDRFGRIEYVNRKFVSTTGYSSREVIGKKPSLLKSGKTPPEVYRDMWTTLNSGNDWRGEFRNRRKDGSLYWVAGHFSTLKDINGNIANFLAIEMDITEQKRAEQQLRESEERFRSFYQLNPDIFMITNLEDGICIDVNDGFTSVTGYSREEVIGQSTEGLNLWKNPEDRKKLKTGLEKDGLVRNLEAEFRKKDGTFWPGIMTASCIKAGDKTHILSSTKDITESRKTEEALRRSQKLEAIGQLSGGIAHDFNNLLGVIMGNLEILQRKIGDDESLNKWINTALNSTQRGAKLTQSLLRFSRTDTPARKHVSVNHLIRDMEDILEKSLTAAIEIKLNLSEDLWQTNIDPGDFADALLNLVINARDAMPQGGTLRIETTNVALGTDLHFENLEILPGDYIRLDISDTGIGMTPDIVAHAFEPFFSTKDKDKGTGLGLSMVFGFVRRSGGDITITSAPSKGATFSVFLPKSNARSNHIERSGKVNISDLLGSERILIVDDDEQLLEIAIEYLGVLGYKTLSAISGEQALEILQNETGIDLMFSDVVMPGDINGFELARRANTLDPELKILLTSGFANKDALMKSGIDFSDEFIKNLATKLVPKPYDLQSLAVKLRETLDGE